MSEFAGLDIVILDDDKDSLNMMCGIIKTELPDCNVYGFESTSDPEYIELLERVYINLFIIDVVLDQQNGKRVGEELSERFQRSTFLFVSGYDYSFEDFQDLRCDCVYDFAQKPFETRIFINRIKILLKVAKTQKKIYTKLACYEEELSNVSGALINSLWQLFNYSNFYVLALNEHMEIILANYYLARALGFNSEDNIVGENWLNFISESDKAIIKHIHTQIAHDRDLKTFREHVNDIISLNSKVIPVRWFNSNINQGLKGTFSVGVPVAEDVSKEESVDTVRAYWRDIIETDKTTIRAMKNILEKKVKQE